jgi:membrane associated rhomboid family serine protease
MRAHPFIVTSGVIAAIAGVLLVALGNETASIIGAVLIGLSAVIFVALAFLLVGEGEERDRITNPRG